MIDPATLRRLAMAWNDISKEQLVDAGVISGGVGGSDCAIC